MAVTTADANPASANPATAALLAAAAAAASTEQDALTEHARSPTSTTRNRHSKHAPFDVTLLRRVLRLVHCLQKERGASCAYYASKHATDAAQNRRSSHFVSTVGPAHRRDTDRALQLSLLQGRDLSKTLCKIRNMLEDGSVQSGLHRILVCFNTLISSVIHEYVLRQTAWQAVQWGKEKPSLQQARNARRRRRSNDAAVTTASTPSSTPSVVDYPVVNALQHGATIQHIPDYSNQGSHSAVFSHHHLLTTTGGGSNNIPRIHSDVDLLARHNNAAAAAAATFKASESLTPSSDPSTARLAATMPSCTPPDTLSSATAVAPRGRPRSNTSIMESTPPASLLPSLSSPSLSLPHGSTKGVTFDATATTVTSATDDTFDESDTARVVRLLHLLGIFVQLKESTGVERAIVSTILTAGQDTALLLNDLVLEVENQRRRVQELTSLRTGSLKNLVQELVALNPAMLQLQQRILAGQDLQESFLKTDKLWDLLTVYIDKLHSLELLIVEEIECCAPAAAITAAGTSAVAEQAKDEQKNTGGLLGQQLEAAGMAGTGQIVTGSPVKTNRSAPMDLLQQMFASTGCGSVGGLPDNSILTNEQMLRQVESMSATDLKELLVLHLSDAASGLVSPESSSLDSTNEATGVEDLLKQISCAPASAEWEIDLYAIRFQKRIGQGSAGTTYLASWSGQQVAVKVASITEMGLEGWRTEVQALQKIHHPNIIRLLGSVYHPSPLTICLVLEYCNAGDLSNAIHKLTPRNFFFHVATSIANGMAYLHSRGTIHRDIKPANVLLDGDFASGKFSVQLTDFGFATETTIASDRTAETGTYRWMAPEVIRHESYSSMADVYSFAVLMWQLLTREDPFSNKSQIEAAAGVAMDGTRPPFPEGTPVAVKELIETCWSDDPTKRLPFDQISLRLNEIEAGLTEDEKRWIEASRGHAVYKKPQIRSKSVATIEPIPPQQLNTAQAQQAPPKKTQKQDKRGSGLMGMFRAKT